ncbi:MAG: serine/threonine-protein kinase [Hyalangium sp.]|uniref:serine/threonine-protein kinase n=1 Tax=Hyalangium sp. TaxID=2028555 RepID=UPI00389A57A0
MKCPSCGKQMPGNMAFCPWDGHALAPAPSSAPRPDPLLETRVSEYVIKERIGAGGMGIVYRAVQPLIGKQVAIKILKAEYAGDADVVQRLLVEARVVNAIQHRGIIDIFGFGQLADGRPYVVMELLHGVALSTFLRKRKKLGADEAVGILDEILSALVAAHKEGVIHRDLKPGNVFLVENGEGARSVKLLDFGIAKVVQFRPSRPLTAQGNILGTPEYMAPEQVRGEAVGPTTDLYAVGIIAFQLLTGRLPFTGEATRVLLAQVDEKPPAPSSLVPEVPPALENIVLRLLAKQATKRFQSAEAVRKELAALGAKRPPTPEPETTSGKTTSLGSRTIEVPMMADASDETEPAPIEPFTDVTLSRPAKSYWRLGAGMAGLVLATTVVAVTALHKKAPAPPKVAEAPAPSAPTPASAPAPQAPSPLPPPTMAPEAPSVPPTAVASAAPEKAPKPPAVETPKPKKIVKAVAAKPPREVAPKTPAHPAPEATPAAATLTSSGSHTDSKSLLARISDAESRMLKVNPLICTNSSPAFAALKDLEKQIHDATTEDQRTKLAGLLAAWEQKFLPKP